jgi:hypothetical protein
VTRLEIRGQKQLEFLYIIGDVDTGQNENNCADDVVVGNRCTVLRNKERKKKERKKKERKKKRKKE